MKFIETPTLRIAYQAWNPQGAKTALLLHGWPDSARCWNAVAPVLAQEGFHVIAPSLRGYGQTRFQKANQPRSGQLAALGRDLLELIDALKVNKPLLVGHDWGARAVANACGLRPGVASHLVMLSVGYGTNSPDQTLSMEQCRNYWYHWYMATPRGQKTVREDRRAFSQMMWDSWAPAGWYTAEEFEQTAADFDNPDWAEVVLSSYQHRWGFVAGDPAYDPDEALLHPAPVLNVPTLVLHGAVDGVNHPDSSAGKEHFFQARYQRQLLPGVGHFPQREAPQQVAQAIINFLKVGA
jgi:pimeloyl-ACP methyl ester carboxylesterase